MFGIVLNLPPAVENYFAMYSIPEIGAHALLFLGWIPIFGVIIWGFTQVWVDFKQGKYFDHINWVLLNITIPPGSINTPKGMENFFNNIAGSKSAITWKEAHLDGKFQAYFSLEIVSCEGDVKFYIRTPERYQDLVEAALYAQYPEAQITEVEDYVGKIPDKYPDDKFQVFGSEMAMGKPEYYPLRTYEDFEHTGEKDFRFKDPMLNTFEIMGKMHKDEFLWLQIIIMSPDSQDWAEAGEKYLMKLMGKEEKKAEPGIISQVAGALGSLPAEALKQATGMELGGASEHEVTADDFRMFKLTPSERELADAIALKISKIGWYTKIRAMYVGPKDHFRKPLMAAVIKGIFHPMGHLGMNKLKMHDPATPKDDYFWLVWQIHTRMNRLVRRFKLRLLSAGAPPYILNSAELATLFHFPAGDARTPVLAAGDARRGEAPTTLPFAGEDTPDLPDWKELVKEQETGTGPSLPPKDDTGALAAPTPHMHGAQPQHLPAEAVNKDERLEIREERREKSEGRSLREEPMPQPGMPAPLPPGLELAETTREDDTDDAPPNLPVL